MIMSVLFGSCYDFFHFFQQAHRMSFGYYHSVRVYEKARRYAHNSVCLLYFAIGRAVGIIKLPPCHLVVGYYFAPVVIASFVGGYAYHFKITAFYF